MVINDTDFGRLGNRLFLFAHLIAFCEKTKTDLINPRFAPYRAAFPAFRHDPLCRYTPTAVTGNTSWRKELGLRLLILFRHFLPKLEWRGQEELDFDSERFRTEVQFLSAPACRVFRGWLLRGYGSLKEYRHLILPLFRLDPHIESAAQQWTSGVRKGRSYLVGVHIRWKDYRGTPNYFELTDFHREMRTMAGLLKGDCRFAVFSDENLGNWDWVELDAVLCGRDALTELSAMSRCDYLMGPPSTFSGWSAFAGSVPLYHLRPGRALKSLEDFTFVHG